MKHVMVVSDQPYRNEFLVRFLEDVGCSAEVHCSPVDDEFWVWLANRIELRRSQPEVSAIVFWDDCCLDSIRKRGPIREMVACLTPAPLVIFMQLEESTALFEVDAPEASVVTYSYSEFKKDCQDIFRNLGLIQPKW